MPLLRKILLAFSNSENVQNFIKGHRFTRNMTRRFIAGERFDDAIEAIRKINASGQLATLDRLGENVSTKEAVLEAARSYIDILEQIEAHQIQSNISLKLTELGLDLSDEFCYENLLKIVAKAAQLNNFIRIDMEGSSFTERTLAIFRRAYQQYKNVGVVIQSYLYRSENDIDDLIALGARVRLCKGAYNEPPNVAFPRKSKVDKNFISLMKKLLKNGNYPAIATHDQKIIEQTKAFAESERIDRSKFEFQMLYGIRRDLQEALVKEGYRVRIYVPYGKEWYRYFMRRLAERPANLFFFLSHLKK